jgi:hypothetical protein
MTTSPSEIMVLVIRQSCACDETIAAHTMTRTSCQKAAEWLERTEQQTTCGYCGYPVVTRCEIVPEPVS